MIQFQGVSKSFGEVEALAPLDLEIKRSEWLGVFGRNGSGKTSMLRILVGLSRPSSGQILFDGVEPTARDRLSFRQRLGFMPERIAFHENLTATKTLRYYAHLKGADPSQVARILDQVGLAEAADRRLAGYSKGMLQRLNLAQALLGDPEILVLDEPIEGLDPGGIRDLFSLVRSLDGATVVISSHQLARVAREVDRICVLSAGRLTAIGTEPELSRRVHLPLRVSVYPTPESNGSLEGSLRELGATSVTRREERIDVEVPQEKKIDFLTRLGTLHEEIDDLRVEEPSFEEVFLETD